MSRNMSLIHSMYTNSLGYPTTNQHPNSRFEQNTPVSIMRQIQDLTQKRKGAGHSTKRTIQGQRRFHCQSSSHQNPIIGDQGGI